MEIIDKLFNKNYSALKIIIFIFIISVIIIINLLDFLILNKGLLFIIIDLIVTVALSAFVLYFVFKLVENKEKQLKEQVDQLTEAYKYIGQINRKIDNILELDISYLDQSKNRSDIETFKSIFIKLTHLVNAEAGFLYLKPPFDYRMSESQRDHKRLKNVFKKLLNKKITEFKYSKDYGTYFKDLNVPENILEKYDLLVKPIYMHNQDIGLIFFAFNKKERLEERDLNIIRVFSFYLALNATFRPDFTIYKT